MPDARSTHEEAAIDMSAEPQSTDDTVRLSMLQAIQTLQQDQLRVLEILGKLIHGMEALDQRLQKLEAGHAGADGDEERAEK
jgi:hypothetical protein